MSRRLVNRLWLLLVLFMAGLPLYAQGGTDSGFSPYSVYGVGDLHFSGTAYNRSMGGVGVAARTKRFVNIMNPASVTERDSLSFMADFGLSGRSTLYVQGDSRNLKNIMNINDFVISFPLWRKTAFMVGIMPFSDMGFNMSYADKTVDGDENIAYTGNRTYSASGNGSINQFFAGGGITFWNRLSIGAQYTLLFGSLNKKSSVTFNDASYRSPVLGDSLQITAHTVKLGVQWEQPVSRSTYLTLGATYRLKAKMKGHATGYSNISEMDLGQHEISDDNVSFGDELGVGVSFKNPDKWSWEMDYVRSDWSSSGFDAVRGFRNNGSVPFSASVAQSVRTGFEFTPNRNDIRYFLKRCTYRAGAYFDQSYYKVGGKNVSTIGISMGMTLPVFQGANGITLGVNLARRGFGSNLVGENYLGFHVGFNIYDIWFRKTQYR